MRRMYTPKEVNDEIKRLQNKHKKIGVELKESEALKQIVQRSRKYRGDFGW